MSMGSCDPDSWWSCTLLTAHQLGELEKAHDRDPYPKACVRQHLALTLNLSNDRVRNWFRNRRRQENLQTPRRNDYAAPKSQTTNVGSTYSRNSAVSPSEIVKSWTVNPTVSTYSTSSHSNLLLPAVSLNEQSPHSDSLPSTMRPYVALSGQYTPYMYQQLPVRRHIAFGNPFMRSTQQLPPTSGAYVTFSGQHTPSMPEIQQFADGQHFESGSPPLGCDEFAAIVDEMYNMYCTSGVPNEEDLNEPNNIFYFGN